MKELFTAVYLDNHLIDPKKNGYEDMITLVRETGSCYYSDSQVENGAAVGAYAKSEKTQKYYANSLDMEANEWIRLKWDYIHLVLIKQMMMMLMQKFLQSINILIWPRV